MDVHFSCNDVCVCVCRVCVGLRVAAVCLHPDTEEQAQAELWGVLAYIR